MDILDSYEPWSGVRDKTHEVPGIIEFVTSDRYLDRPNLYPRQGTFLKVMFLKIEEMTEYDFDVIDQWESEYVRTADKDGEGNEGTPPGILDRIRLNRICPCSHDKGEHTISRIYGDDRDIDDRTGEYYPGMGCSVDGCDCRYYRGRHWFREVVAPIGRRGSKGHMGAIAAAYILWHYMAKGDPQAYYGVDRGKRLTGVVFAGKKEQAKDNQWADINRVILEAPCFTKAISRPLGESLTIKAPNDDNRARSRSDRGIKSSSDIASFEIVPKESTPISARGIAAFLQIYDEAAHVIKGVAKAPAEDVYEQATPALDQFGRDGFIYIPSSPWQRIGLFHDKYQEARELDEGGLPVYPEKMLLQLPSWGLYEDWEKAHQIPMAPGSLPYKQLKAAIQEYDDDMRQIERANPETFKVERRAHFAAVLDAYLNPARIADMWDESMVMATKGILSATYRAHGDPSKSGAQFGFAIGHVERYDERGLPHVHFDIIDHWDPAEFDNHEVDYNFIGEEIEDYMDRFMPAELTFDQFNSVSTIQRLRRHAAKRKYPKRVQIYERSATGPLNWKTYETFKTALGLGLLHGPYYEWANMELTFLQDKGGKVEPPDSGPVQTKDVADCLAIVTYELIGDELAAMIGKQLSDLKVSPSAPGGMDAYKEQRPEEHEALSSFGKKLERRGLERRLRQR